MSHDSPCRRVARYRARRPLLVPVAGGVVFGADDETATFLRAAVDGLDDVDQLLLVLEDPVEFVLQHEA